MFSYIHCCKCVYCLNNILKLLLKNRYQNPCIFYDYHKLTKFIKKKTNDL
jgi:hypothetical protein